MRPLATLLFAIIVFGGTLKVSAERPPEDRDSASHILTGTVEAVFKRDGGANNEYVIALRIEKLEKGEGWEPGEVFYAYCFQRKPDAPKIPSAGGHKAVPKEGQRIRAFVHRRDGTFEGNYPNWFDVLPKEGAASSERGS